MIKLKQVLTQPDAVLFIGSGVSLWSGLPSWSAMIEKLADYIEADGTSADLVRAEHRRGDFLQAASYGFDKLTKTQIGEFIRMSCKYGHSIPQEIHKSIVSLGPRCFITTNYDDLIEQSLRKWQPNRPYRPPVTNRHLTETAEIVHARAVDFIFKPHGDASDSESIILTKEQYRELLPQGERHAALDALKTLLVSRPIIYIGFGLRDPDFLYLRDILANTYKGAVRDHYAIMADVSSEEINYWRRNYGIHLISYETIEVAGGGRSHEALLRLLEDLRTSVIESVSMPLFDPSSPQILLTLARYAAALSRTPQVSPELLIRISNEARKTNPHRYILDKYDNSPVDKFLDNGPEKSILLGLPGAGKTYSMRRSAARIAEKLHNDCLANSCLPHELLIPIYVDLKLYQGNLLNLIDQTLPEPLSFEEVNVHYKSKIYLDSFNEMPREFWESSAYETDFANFMALKGNSSVVIGSRTRDGLDKLNIQGYSLEWIEEQIVTEQLERRGVEIHGRFSSEVKQLLQKPYYFNLVVNGAVTLPSEAHPKDFYHSLFDKLKNAFKVRFGFDFNIEDALSLAAYNAIDNGEEAFPLANVIGSVKEKLIAAKLTIIQELDVVNWLISKSIITPYSGSRVSFIHQSVTEYLAATELAKRYIADNKVLSEKLLLTRWDQTLFLALSLLPAIEAEKFFNDVVKTDFILALNAVKYLEVDRDLVVSKLLKKVPKQIKKLNSYDMGIEWIIESNLPIEITHEGDLRALMNHGDYLAGAAAIRLVGLKGIEVKDELIETMYNCREDYNYCSNGIAEALKPFVTVDDIETIKTYANRLRGSIKHDSKEDKANGFISGAANLLSDLPISDIRQHFFVEESKKSIPEIYSRILCNLLWDHESTESLEFAGELLIHGVNEAATAISFIAEHRNENAPPLSWTYFTSAHMERLIAISISEKSKEIWALRALKCLCKARPDLIDSALLYADSLTAVEKSVLITFINETSDNEIIYDALSKVIAMTDKDRQNQPWSILEAVEYNWNGREKLLLDLLKLRDNRIVMAITENHYIRDFESKLKSVAIGEIEWWLDWLSEDADNFFKYRLSHIIFSISDDTTRNLFVTEFNKCDSKYRKLLCDTDFLNRMDLSTDDFSPEAISFLLSELENIRDHYSFHGEVLGNCATEKFVLERLLPLRSKKENDFEKNLRQVLREAGKRHGRRYC